MQRALRKLREVLSDQQDVGFIAHVVLHAGSCIAHARQRQLVRAVFLCGIVRAIVRSTAGAAFAAQRLRGCGAEEAEPRGRQARGARWGAANARTIRCKASSSSPPLAVTSAYSGAS